MGVTGLWQLVQPTGRPVTLESLEGKVLAVDVSIWLNQLVKGMRDRHGNPLPNAHLLGLFRRVCKLLFYRIRPVFVFDGSVPTLKKQTLAARRQRKVEAAASSTRANEKIVKTMLRHHALRAVLGQSDDVPPSLQNSSPAVSQGEPPIGPHQSQPSTSARLGTGQDMFSLPPLPNERNISEEGVGDREDGEYVLGEIDHLHARYQNLDDVDIESEEFKSLPPDVRHEILTELKLTRKHHSWAHIKDLPQDSDDFSQYQVAKLMRQSKLSQHLDNTRKELNNQGSGDVAIALVGGLHVGDIEARRVVSEDTSHYILIRGLNKDEHQSSCQKLIDNQENDIESKSELRVPDSIKSQTSDKIENITKAELCDVTEISDSQKMTDMKSNLSSHDKLLKPEDVEEIIFIDQDINTELKKSQCKIISAVGTNNGATDASQGNKYDSNAKLNSVSVNVKELDTASTSKSLDYSGDGGFVRELSSDSEEEVQVIGEKNDTLKATSTCNVTSEKSLQRTASPDSVLSLSSDNSNDAIPSTTTTEMKQSKVDDDIIDISADVTRSSDTTSQMPSKVINSKDFMNIASRLIENVPLLPQDIERSAPSTDHAKLLSEIEGKNSIGQKRSADVLLHNKTEAKKSCLEGDGASSKEPIVLNDSDSESDDDMIEIMIDPTTAKPDDKLFPPEIFTQAPARGDGLTPDLEKPGTQEMDNTASVPEEISLSNYTEDHPMAADTVEVPDEEPVLVNEFEGMSQAELVELEQDLVVEGERLRAVRGQQERLAASISDQMSAEAQDLLRLFGVPFIVSPTEAEAQCAQLDISGMTHGTITDDSDIWLFGGERVYKNFFNQDKHVEFYRASDIHSRMMLDRHRLINLALLCGSDYTEGVEGIGPVTAMEVFSEFAGDGLEPLDMLKNWWDEAQKQDVAPSETKLKSKLRTVELKPGFPRKVVVEAYLKPTVDDSTEPFTWARPDLDLLRTFASERFGWLCAKSDEILLPVMKQINSTQSQTHITSFFAVDLGPPVGVKSKRVKRILTLMKKSGQEDDHSQSEQQEETSKEGENSTGVISSTRGRGRGRGKIGGKTDVTINESQNRSTSGSCNQGKVKGRGRGKGKGLGKGSRGRGRQTAEGQNQGKGAYRTGRQAAQEVKLSESSSESD